MAKLAVLLFALASVFAKESSLDELLTKSGAGRQIDMIPQIIADSAGQKQNAAGASPEASLRLQVLIAKLYRAEDFQKSVRDNMSKSMSDEDMRRVIAWYDSKLGIRIVDAEKQASGDAATKDAQDFLSNLQKSPPPESRIKMVKDIDLAAGTTEMTIEMSIGTFQGLTLALSPMLPKDKQLKPGQLVELSNDVRKQLRPRIEAQNLIGFLYTYRSLSDSELQAYLDYLKTPAAQKYHRALNRGLRAAFDSVALKFGGEFGRSLASKQRK